MNDKYNIIIEKEEIISRIKIIAKQINSDYAGKTLDIVCLVNSVRPIKDKRGRPLTFVNFNDGSGVMDGIVSSEALENCHEIVVKATSLS